MNISHRRFIVIGQGQLLQMDKAGPLHVAGQVHLYDHRLPGKDDGADRLEENRPHVDRGKLHRALRRHPHHEMVDRVLLVQRENDINDRGNRVECKAEDEAPAEIPEERRQLFPDPPVKRLRILFLFDGHHASSFRGAVFSVRSFSVRFSAPGCRASAARLAPPAVPPSPARLFPAAAAAAGAS